MWYVYLSLVIGLFILLNLIRYELRLRKEISLTWIILAPCMLLTIPLLALMWPVCVLYYLDDVVIWRRDGKSK